MATYTNLGKDRFEEMICGGAANLVTHKAEINNLNVFPVPDGDTGDNMFMTYSSGVREMRSASSVTIADSAAAFSHGMLLGARGNSGVILSQFFSGIARTLAGKDEVTTSELEAALTEGVKCAYGAVSTPTEGTMLTVAREGVKNALGHGETVASLFEKVKEEMFSALEKTPEQLPVLREAGVVDSGGAGLCYIFEGMSDVLAGRKTAIAETNPEEKTDGGEKKCDIFAAFTEDSVMTYGYCTEFLLRLQTSKVDIDSFDTDVITDFLKTVGDSIVSFKDGSIVKVHVHTMTPEKVLGFCRQFGEFLTVKIENMSVQHSAKLSENETETAAEETSVPEKEYGTVVVCSGDGMRETFEELGADAVIDGGQTNNPSTEDFLATFRKVNARHIFVFPNNANIILAARQAAELYDGAVVHVFKNKDLGSGYVGITAIDPDASSVDEIIETVNEAMSGVVTGCVSPAVRTTSVGGVSIEAGDNICFVGKTMVASKKERIDSTFALIEYLLEDGEKYMLTAFCGSDLTATERDALNGYMKKNHPDIEFYTVDGGQPVYSCIIAAE